MTTSNQTVAGVARAAVLVELNVSLYSGRKQDKQTQATVVANNSANSKKAASVYKNLFAECKELDDITKFRARASATHYRWTMPWSDHGPRLLPTASLMAYKADMNRLQTEFDALVAAFLDKYDTLVASAAFQLGTLFDRSEYPEREVVARRFRMETSVTPLPVSGDFRLDVESEVQQELIDEYEKKISARLEQASKDLWERLHAALSRLSDRLTIDEIGDVTKRRTFHSTAVTSALELCDMLGSLNVAGDANLESARRKLEGVLSGVSADDLRKHDAHRLDVKRQVDQIINAFDWEIA